jgi:hypothetical protein
VEGGLWGGLWGVTDLATTSLASPETKGQGSLCRSMGWCNTERQTCSSLVPSKALRPDSIENSKTPADQTSASYPYPRPCNRCKSSQPWI